MAKKRGNVSKKDLIALLHADNYSGAQQLGIQVIEALKGIIQGNDVNLTAKATYVAGLINDDRSVDVIELAAKSRTPAVRVAAASAAAHLSAERAEPILMRLLKSKDVGIRKVALNAASGSMTEKVRLQVQKVRKLESNQHLKSLASSILKPSANR